DERETLTYRFVSEFLVADRFALDPATGQLYVGDAPSMAAGDLVVLDVRATSDGPGRLHATAAVSIEVVEDNRPPVMPERVNRTVLEFSPVGHPVGAAVEGHDPGQALAYRIVGDNSHSVFSTETLTAQLRVARAVLNYHTRSAYELVVEAVDNGLGPCPPPAACTSAC
ncbi:MAG: cadherin repeat domain-containing protein, partial [Hydrogenophaga sp.]